MKHTWFGNVPPEKHLVVNVVIRSRKSKWDRQYNGQKKKDKQWYIKHYTDTKDRAARTHEKPEVNLGDPHVTPVVLMLNYTNIIWYLIVEIWAKYNPYIIIVVGKFSIHVVNI